MNYQAKRWSVPDSLLAITSKKEKPMFFQKINFSSKSTLIPNIASFKGIHERRFTMYDFHDSTDIFVNPSFLPFCTQKAPWISSKNRYLGAKSCTWPSWILNVSRIVKIIHSVPCSQLSIRWLELHNLCNILWSLFSKYFLKMLISY